ncbi:MAG: hypothetical protein CR975_00725 [Gammaproteobacteria bacterium]|nr:MAG: hypothetical protein CR975_00725 [Gammaproteobacteria bacterium]
MSAMLTFLLAWLLPWVLGTVISLACLKRRYGYRFLAVGSGYLLGLLITLLTQHYATSLSVTLIIEAVLAVIIAFFFRAKRCTIEEQRLEKASPNSAYLLTWLLLLLLMVKFLMMYANLGDVAAKDLLTAFEAGSEPLWKATGWGISSAAWLGLNQYYMTLLPPASQDWIYLLWLGVSGATALFVFGGLRYLGCRLLPAMLGAYMVMSLPFMMGQSALTNALSIVFIAYYLWLLLLLAILIGFVEKRPVLLVMAAFFVVSAYQYWLFFALVTAVACVAGRFVGVLPAILSALVLLFIGLMIMGGSTHHSMAIFNQVIFIASNWHFAALAGIISLLVFVFYRRRYHTPALELLLIGGTVALLAMLGIIFGKYPADTDADIITIVAYFTPFICFIPVSVYHLTNQDKDSLPVI